MTTSTEPQFETVALSVPFQLGDNEIKELTFRRPTSGDLRGCKLLDILQMDIDSHFEILPRICNEISSVDIARQKIDISDIAKIAKTIVAFFKPSQAGLQ